MIRECDHSPIQEKLTRWVGGITCASSWAVAWLC